MINTLLAFVRSVGFIIARIAIMLHRLLLRAPCPLGFSVLLHRVLAGRGLSQKGGAAPRHGGAGGSLLLVGSRLSGGHGATAPLATLGTAVGGCRPHFFSAVAATVRRAAVSRINRPCGAVALMRANDSVALRRLAIVRHTHSFFVRWWLARPPRAPPRPRSGLTPSARPPSTLKWSKPTLKRLRRR